MASKWQEALMEAMDQISDPAEAVEFLNEVRRWVHRSSPQFSQPVDLVQWVPADKVRGNAYNPNSVANREMTLLHTSIEADGFTQPIVVVEDGEGGYIVVDGFHRMLVGKTYDDTRDRLHGMLPVVLLDCGLEGRMAATVRHNRARGQHNVEGMSSLVYSMLDSGVSDAEICNELGMEAEELVRLKYITGFAKLFSDKEYSPERRSRSQVKLSSEWENEHGAGTAVV